MSNSQSPWSNIPARILSGHRVLSKDAPANIRLAGGEVPQDVYVFEAEVSNNRVDSYFTHMSDDTLINFARSLSDSSLGIAFVDSHDGTKLPIGYSVGGRYETDGQGNSRVIGTFYTVPGIKFGGRHSYASTDDLIRAIETGLARDVSVGFYGGDWTCDVCGLDYYSFWQGREVYCTHVAGNMYTRGAEGEEQEEVLATVTINNANLSEVSAVYDGATPGAMILKAERAAASGLIDQGEVAQLEQRFRVRLPIPIEGAETMRMSKRNTAIPAVIAEEQVDEVVEIAAEVVQHEELELVEQQEPVVALVEEGDDEDVDVDVELAVDESMVAEAEMRKRVADDIRAVYELMSGVGNGTLSQRIAAVLKENRQLRTERKRLLSLADDGQKYRNDLIEQAVANGVRAQGNTFPVEQYRALFAEASIEQIKAINDGFKNVADIRLPSGRKSTDITSAEKNSTDIPAGAYIG